ncbi:transposase [Leifsonia sp. WHRI 6310E]|uniref:transposase n=1 Tax=Leifsonia sp. WHRI 6310E TaxID=3162562 RepID=UPI0032EF3C7D
MNAYVHLVVLRSTNVRSDHIPLPRDTSKSGSAREPVVADVFSYVVGVDTHAESHVYAVLVGRTGELWAAESFRADPEGVMSALRWLMGTLSGDVLLTVEGANSYGALLAQRAIDAGLTVCNARPPRRGRTTPKTDQSDAVMAAWSVLGTPVAKLSQPRARGARRTLAMLISGRREMEVRSVAIRNRLNGLVRTTDFGLDTTIKLDIAAIRRFTTPEWVVGDRYEVMARQEVARLAEEYLRLRDQLIDNKVKLETLVQEIAPGLLDLFAVGPVTGAIILAAYSHLGRVRSESAFASLAGIAPIDVSSGKTVRHRLNVGGDRQLNGAVHTIVLVRLIRDPRSRAYLERRLTEGATRRQVLRSLKRYVIRDVFRKLDRIMREQHGLAASGADVGVVEGNARVGHSGETAR